MIRRLLIAALLLIGAGAVADEGMVLYLREGWPAHGQPFKPYQPDAGRLLPEPPATLDEVWCGIWAQYDFDAAFEDREPYAVHEMYARVWLYSVDGKGTIGLDPNGGYDDKIDDKTKIEITPGGHRSRAYRFRLYCTRTTFDQPITLDFSKPYKHDGSAYRFTWKWLAASNQPITRCSPAMTSFLWLNPPAKDALQKRDTDNDGLDDWNELETHFTNPFSADTDKDGLADATELERKLDPNNPDTDLDGIGDAQDAHPRKAQFDVTLDAPDVRGRVRYDGKRILVRGPLRIAPTSRLTLRNCVVFMDKSPALKPKIIIEERGELAAEGTTFRSRDGRTLYPVEIKGRARLSNCRLHDAEAWTVLYRGNARFKECLFDYNYRSIVLRTSKNLIEDCTFDHAHFGLHIDLRGEATRNTIRNCRFDHALFSAIEVHDDSGDNVIEGCDFKRSDHAVVLKSKRGHNTVRRCAFLHCNGGLGISSPQNLVEENGFSGRAWAHITFGGAASNNVLRGNVIKDAEISLWGKTVRGNLFENNTFVEIPGKAILLKDGARENVFRNNEFRAIRGTAIVICTGCNDNVFEKNRLIPPTTAPVVEKGAGNVVRDNVTVEPSEE